jgi:hypothetical protein
MKTPNEPCHIFSCLILECICLFPKLSGHTGVLPNCLLCVWKSRFRSVKVGSPSLALFLVISVILSFLAENVADGCERGCHATKLLPYINCEKKIKELKVHKIHNTV